MSATSFWRVPRRATLLSLSLVCVSAGLVSTLNAQDKGAPPWGEFLRRFEKDRLLKLPYHMAEETTPKGLASKIRARELDVPNRIKAIEYLASLDYAQFPEAKEMLIIAMQEDQWERVRLAAAKGLRDMLERNGCGSNNGNGNCRECEQQSAWAKAKSYCIGAVDSLKHGSKHKSKKDERQAQKAEDCRCKNCCDEATLNALAKTAYEMDERGCPVEPSARVREMAVEAINVCGIECHYRPYYATPVPAVAPPPIIDPEGVQSIEGEGVPTFEDETLIEEGELPIEAKLPPLPNVTTQKSKAAEPTPINHLNKICIVSWRDGVRVKPNPEVTAVHKGRIYQFADEECKARFEAAPEDFAVAFGGCDPVEFVKSKEVVVGRYLVDCEGHFYMFSTMENLDEFNANAEKYTLNSKRIVRVSGNE